MSRVGQQYPQFTCEMKLLMFHIENGLLRGKLTRIAIGTGVIEAKFKR